MPTHSVLAHSALTRRLSAPFMAFALAAALLLMTAGPADAAIVATVPLATAAEYAVLGGQTVTNTGATTMNRSLGVSPLNTAPGFTGPPNGQVNAPGVIHLGDAEALQAQSDLTAAYLNAAGRPLAGTNNGNTPAELGGLNLQGGVYAGPSKGALQLTGTLTLDAAGNPNTVFIIQTNSSLTTAPGSVVSLIGGAQECNVFWQIGSSATLDTGSTFVGNLMALTSIFVSDSVTIHGRTLARNGEVTLINDTFVPPTCATTADTPSAPGTPTTPGEGPTTPTASDTPTDAGSPGTPGIDLTEAGPGVPGISGPPRTGATPLQGTSLPMPMVLLAGLITVGTAGVLLRRRELAQRAAGGAISHQ